LENLDIDGRMICKWRCRLECDAVYFTSRFQKNLLPPRESKFL